MFATAMSFVPVAVEVGHRERSDVRTVTVEQSGLGESRRRGLARAPSPTA
jgi:hypothetical protein